MRLVKQWKKNESFQRRKKHQFHIECIEMYWNGLQVKCIIFELALQRENYRNCGTRIMNEHNGSSMGI